MIIDSHEHIMFPTQTQLTKMDNAGIDKTILFGTLPHPEKAISLSELETEMNTLNNILSGVSDKEVTMNRHKKNISELVQTVRAFPNRFLAFGNVPLGFTLSETSNWIDSQIVTNSFCGIGEFTPGNEDQILQLETVFQALLQTKVYPVWIHTFHPVTLNGLHLLMELCKKYPNIPVIFGHLGGVNWIPVLHYSLEQPNIYLDLSASFTSLATKMALTELPDRCLFSSDAPYGEPYLYRQQIEYISPNRDTTSKVLGENISRLLSLA